MVVNFNPAMSTGNTIAFGKSESKGVMPRVSMSLMADSVEIKQAAKESKGFFANTGRYIRRALGVGAIAGTLVACDPTGIGNEIENTKLLSSAELLDENLDLINLGATNTTKSATVSGSKELAALKSVSSNLKNPKFEAINPDGTSAGRIEGELFDIAEGKTDTLKYWFRDYLSNGEEGNVGFAKAYEQTASDGKSQNLVIERFVSADHQYASMNNLMPPAKYEIKRNNKTLVQRALQGAEEVVNYTADAVQRAAKQELTDLGYTRTVFRR